MKKAVLHVLCIDEETCNTLLAMKLPDMHVFSAERLESSRLAEIKRHRSLSEYCWTLKPFFMLHILEENKNLDFLAYLDSDLFFLDSPMRIFNKYNKCNIILTTHKVNRRANGGFVSFRRSQTGMKALLWWREKCLEWCHAYNEGEKFADQGYLDIMRKRYDGVCYADIAGVNIATWNYFNYDFREEKEALNVGGCPVIFYHFSGFSMKRIGNSVCIYGADFPCEVCSPYLKEIRKAIEDIEKVNSSICDDFYSGV